MRLSSESLKTDVLSALQGQQRCQGTFDNSEDLPPHPWLTLLLLSLCSVFPTVSMAATLHCRAGTFQ